MVVPLNSAIDAEDPVIEECFWNLLVQDFLHFEAPAVLK